MVRGTDIQKTYHQLPVLKKLSFEIQKGRITALAGPNGAGKTTLLKILAQIQKPDSGELIFEGGRDAFRERLGYVPQQNAFFYELTVKENLQYWQKGEGGLEAVAARFKLKEVLQKRAAALSGGLQRRLNMAIALINNPQFLIMDEPLTGVDITARMDFLGWMRDLKQNGLTILYSTHHTDEIKGIADDLIFLKEGELVFCGAIQKIGQEIDEFIFNSLANIK